MRDSISTLDYSRRRKSDTGWLVFGLLLIVFAVALPFVAKWWGDGFVERAMITDPVPQSAMLVAWASFVGSIVFGTVMFIVGAIVLFVRLWPKSLFPRV
jgi:hypothetical protein